MKYKPLRKDLTETTRKCDFCPKYLTSLKAYVLEEIDTGKIVYAGPTCTKNNVASNFSLAGIPDFTRYTLPNGESENASGGTGGYHGMSTDDPSRRVKEYLELREEKLAKEMQCSDSVLRIYYIKSKIEPLTDTEIIHVNSIEDKSPEKFKFINLYKCYNYLFWLDIAINKLSGDPKFLISIRSTLVTNGKISDKQKNGVNKWLSKIEGIPSLK
jgi:hypothetical protein